MRKGTKARSMAKYVGYFENFETPEEESEAFSQGPFVVVDANGYRIEAQVKGNKCPALPITGLKTEEDK